jgi:4a-hydroxytetrahydrobiopterin dehydratase
MTKLSAAEVDRRVRALDGWKRKGDFITKEFKFEEFMDGIRFVDDIAETAEKLGHHPDIHIRWTTVRLEIQTHDEGGITALDLKLAAKIDGRKK